MSLHDLYLISPQLSMAALAVLVILADLAIPRKGWVSALALVGLVAPFAFTLVQLFGLPGGILGSGAENLVPETGILYDSLAVDRFSVFFNLLVVPVLALVFLASIQYVLDLPRLRGEFYGLMLLSASGMMLLASAQELITIYVALELTTLPLVAIAASLPNAKSSEAGMKFLVIGAISSALTLYGMALLYGFSGSTTLEGIALALGGPVRDDVPFGSYAVLVGIAVLTVGIAFKLSAIPSQMWVPDVYEGAPIPMVAFLSVASKAVAFALLLRFLYSGLLPYYGDWGTLLAVLAAVTMTAGNLAALAQSNIRRLLGYSTIAHAGYLLVGVAAVAQLGGFGDWAAIGSQSPTADAPANAVMVLHSVRDGNSAIGGDLGFTTFGPSSVLFYLVAYAAANLTAFFAILAVHSRTGSDLIEDYGGVFRRFPFLSIALAVALVALIGVPPTGIFIGKIYLFLAAVNSELAWLALVGAINSVISAYYYVRIIRVMFLAPESEAVAAVGLGGIQSRGARVSPFTLVALALTLAATVLLGVLFGPVIQAAEGAVSALPGILLQ